MGLKRDIQRTASFISNHPVTQRRPVAAWWRWFKWQLRSRLTSGPHLVDWIGRARLVVDHRMTGATGNVYCGLHEFADMALVIHFLSGQPRPSDSLLVDVGANVGSYTILAAGVAGAQAVSIEPSPSTFASLQRNVVANQLQDRVTLVQAAVGEHEGEIRFSMDRDCENQVVDEDYLGVSDIVPLKSLDDLIRGRSPVKMKLDVEGFEDQALAGAHELLGQAKLQVILLETVSAESASVLQDFGFSKYDYDAMNRRVVDMSATSFMGNQLWLRDREGVERICQNSPQFDVYGLKI